MIRRNISHVIRSALRDTPVVLVHGARQTGKTTLVRGIVLYTGSEVIAFGKKLLAVPIAALWTLAR